MLKVRFIVYYDDRFVVDDKINGSFWYFMEREVELFVNIIINLI